MKIKTSEIINFKLILGIFSIFIVSMNIIFDLFNTSNNSLTAILTLMVSLYLFIYYRDNVMLFLVFSLILYFNYSFIITVYFKQPNIFLFRNIENLSIRGIGINIVLLFMATIMIFIDTKKNYSKSRTNYNILIVEKTNYLFAGLVLSALLLILFLNLFSLNIGGINLNALYEYGIIFFIMGFYFSGENKFLKIFFIILLLIFSIFTFLDGDRVSVMQMIIATLLMHSYHKLNYKKLVPLIIIGIIALTGIGLYGDGEFTALNLPGIIEILGSRYFTVDTSYAAYYSSLTFIIVRAIFTPLERFDLFVNFLLSILLGGNTVSNSSLPTITNNFIKHYNGGFLPMYFYFYLGIGGVLLSAFIVSTYIKKAQNLNEDTSDFTKLIIVYFVSTTPRWYLYSPSPLLRGFLIFSLIYYSFYWLRRVTLKVLR